MDRRLNVHDIGPQVFHPPPFHPIPSLFFSPPPPSHPNVFFFSPSTPIPLPATSKTPKSISIILPATHSSSSPSHLFCPPRNPQKTTPAPAGLLEGASPIGRAHRLLQKLRHSTLQLLLPRPSSHLIPWETLPFPAL
ncbi:hypothetical protein VTJ04DRAFT_504 [Mycothermus thermophilus]|uniref:uncharacterized protein n=1 Tax=Humicola insolens TaxID=85995 RepID=UPI003743C587